MKIILSVAERDAATNINTLRVNGDVPAIVYGPKQEPISIVFPLKEFAKVRKEAGESTIVELNGLKEPIEVLIKEIEFNPVKQEIMHVDFYAIERGKDMTTTVALEFIGDAPAEKANLGTVSKVMQEITVTCRPSNLPSNIEVDLTSLETENDRILVSDLKALDGVVFDAELDSVIASIILMKEEVEEEVVPEAPDMDSIEVEQKGKDETDGAEGEGEKSE